MKDKEETMEPKEKAEELMETFGINGISRQYTETNALRCVDEIISACEYNHVESWNTDWWKKVKGEIEKL